MDYTIISKGVKVREGSWEVHPRRELDSDHQLVTCEIEMDVKDERIATLPYAYKKMQD